MIYSIIITKNNKIKINIVLTNISNLYKSCAKIKQKVTKNGKSVK
jgi:phenylacetate-coenzyme A ligase PaaK-like adenylate-forming protein